ncbi:MAG: hypothetical protein ACFFD4_21740 [Candidatus Odinarchaeota archaeon]
MLGLASKETRDGKPVPCTLESNISLNHVLPLVRPVRAPIFQLIRLITSGQSLQVTVKKGMTGREDS